MTKAKTIHTASIPLVTLGKAGSICAWDGCKETFRGDTMPKGWRSLQLFWAPFGVTNLMELSKPSNIWDRDCVLCPGHARQLDGLLKDIGNRLKETKGSA